MNKARRKLIAAAIAKIAEAQTYIEQARDEEQEAFDAMPESLQDSERGEAIGAAAGLLSEAVDQLDDIQSSLSELLEP